MSDTNNWLGGTSRRDFLRYGAAGGAALLAGCGGGGSGVNRTDQTFTIFDPTTGGTVPTNRHLNPWNPTQQGVWHPGANIFDRAVAHSPASGKGTGIIANDWESVDDTTLEFHLSDEFTWHNGDQVTAHDWQLQFDIGLGILAMQAEEGARPHPLVKGAEATDDTTLQVTFHDPLSEAWALQNATTDLAGRESRGIFTKEGEEPWETWRTRLENGEEGVVGDITTAAKPMLSEDTVANGAFTVSELGDSTIVMEVYEDHPHASSIELKEMELELFEGGLATQPYLSGQVDAAHTGFPIQNDFDDRLPKGHTLFRESLSSNKLVAFNCGAGHNYDTPFSDRRVRQAVMHVYNRSELPDLLQGVNNVFEWGPCRVPGNVIKEETHRAATWVKDDFTTYGQNDTERATQLLKDAGYSREDGKWYRANGDRFEIDWMKGLKNPDHQLMQKNLKNFGVKINQQEVDSATLDERRTAGEYHVMPDGSSANGITSMWTLDLVISWLQSILHFEDEADIPMPIGDPEGSEGTKTINIEEHIRQWQVTGEQKYHKELTWWWNQFMPEIEMMYQPDAGAYRGNDWELDAPEDIVDGIDDALYIAPKLEDGTLRYIGTDETTSN